MPSPHPIRFRRAALASTLLSLLWGSPLAAQNETPPGEATPKPEATSQDPEQQGEKQGPVIPLPRDPEAGDSLVLTLEDALRIGRTRNLGLRADSLTPLQSRQGVRGAAAAFEPELFATFNVARSESPPRNVFSPSLTRNTLDGSIGLRQRVATGALWEVSYAPSRLRQQTSTPGFPNELQTNILEARVTQPILRGAWTSAVLADLRATQRSLVADSARFDRIVQDTLLQIVEAYWELVFTREDYRVRAESLALAREQLRITNERIRVRELAPRDRVFDQAEVARRQEELIRAENEIRRREDALRILLFDDTDGTMWTRGLEPITPIEGEFRAPLRDWRESARSARRMRPDLVAQREEVARAEIQLEQAKRDVLPQLDFTAVYGSTGVQSTFNRSFDDAATAEFPNFSFGLELSVPIGNNAARSARDRALLVVEQTRRRLYAQEIQVISDVRAALRDLRTLAESIRASRESLRLAETQLDTEEQRLRVGRATQFEVQTRRQELLEAKQQLLRNQLDYRAGESRLLHAEGRLSVDGPIRLTDLPEPAEELGGTSEEGR